jgi:hypothetical protein
MYKSIDRLWPKAQPILVPHQNPARTRPKAIAHSPAQCVPRLSRRPDRDNQHTGGCATLPPTIKCRQAIGSDNWVQQAGKALIARSW